jgi:hypothetical protein
MNEQVLLLSKHGQLKQATTKMVQTVMGFLDETPNLETKLSVIETLRTVTEGKVTKKPRQRAARQVTNTEHRYSSRLSARASHGYSPTSRRSKATSTRPRTSSASSRSRHLDP